MLKKVLIIIFLVLITIGCTQQTPILDETPTPTPSLTQTRIPVTSSPTTPETVTSTPISRITQLEFGVKYKVKVLDVIDGDTIDVLLNGQSERVRMLGVDTPEKTADKNKPNEYDAITDLEYLAKWGMNAKDFTESMLEGKYIYIEFDSEAGLRGYYGRLLAYVYLEDGRDFTAELVKQGYARVYVEGDFQKEDYYVQLENEAKQQEKGLWSLTTTATPSPQGTFTVEILAVHYDAEGNDNYNLNDEYVVIQNNGAVTVNLNGWRLEDEAKHTYTFSDFAISPDSSVTVHTGSGVDTAKDLYWGSSRAIWNNDHDIAYLYDAQGSLMDEYSW